ncbi:MAG: hypothetical protein IJR70_01275 [Eubacterium sp.]|nr:hypothetical protein [Eubacterium sp.]
MQEYNEIVSQAAQGNSPAVTAGALIGVVLSIVALWKIFQKAGEEGWKAIIPFYNMFTFVKIIDGNGIKFLLLIIPVVNIVYSIILDIRLARAFGKSGGFAVGLIFLGPIFELILAFDNSEYQGPQK